MSVLSHALYMAENAVLLYCFGKKISVTPKKKDVCHLEIVSQKMSVTSKLVSVTTGYK
jgi:hypothetical protein